MKTLFAWHCNPWRKYSRRWWLHWFDLKDLWCELKCMWHRANYGYSNRDLWSLDMYLTSWLPSALKEFRENKMAYPASLTSEKWDHELKMMELAFVAAKHLNMDCECFSEDGHDAYWRRRWDYCSKVFMKRFFNLWW